MIIGLGNPGAQYKLNRHNIGFMVIDALKEVYSFTETMEMKATVAKGLIEGHKVILVKPQTYMNLSGDSVQNLFSYYNIELEKILVIQDDIDQDFSAMKFQKKRGHGGHNGIRDIHKKLSSNEYSRLKIGVGRPQNSHINVADYVLQNFTDTEIQELSSHLLKEYIESVVYFIDNGHQPTANKFNVKKESK
jgi:PTH1 family peptidyl-tRNA hydrolase